MGTYNIALKGTRNQATVITTFTVNIIDSCDHTIITSSPLAAA